MSYRHFNTELRDDVTLVKLHDPRMFNDFGDLHKELINLVAEESTGAIVVDFTTTSYCPSAVIRSLLILQKELGEPVKLCELNQPTRETFAVLRLDQKLFKIFPTAEDAMASFPR